MIDDLLLPDSANLRDALLVINRNGLGTAFVVDDNGKLKGVVTDGNIRRGLIDGISLESAITSIMTTDCTTLPISAPPEVIFETLSDRIRIIPLLDDDNRPVDFASTYRHHRIPAHEPSIKEAEHRYVTECLETNWVSSQGRFVDLFETEFAAFTGAEAAVAVSSGTAALHLAMRALGVGPGDEVIVPDLTFAASAAAIIHAGATPVLVDVEPDSWNIDPAEMEKAITEKTKAVMPVHLYGQPADMDAIMAIAGEHGILVIEDAAESLGAYHRDRHTGTIGDAGTFSFFGNKLVTTGEGGMIVFKDPDAAGRARILRNHGQTPGRRYWHDVVGYNYRLTNIQAAIGVAQMERIGELMERKLHVASIYGQELAGEPHIILPADFDNRRNIFWAFSIIVDDEASGLDRDTLMNDLERNGIETRPLFYPLHQMVPYAGFFAGRAFPVSESLSRRGLSLPSSTNLEDSEILFVAETIKRLISVKAMVKEIRR